MINTDQAYTIQDYIKGLLSDYVDVSKLDQKFWDAYFAYQNDLLKSEGVRIMRVLKAYVDPTVFLKIDPVLRREFMEYADKFPQISTVVYKPRTEV